jgi:cell division protease FtsH
MRATEIAREMVTKYGFSEKLGPVNYSSSDEVFLGKDFSTRKNYSEEIASDIDAEIRNIIEEAFVEAEKILKENVEKLHEVAEALLEAETLDGEQFEILCTGEKTADELINDIKQREEAIKEANEKEAAESERMRKEEEEAAEAGDGGDSDEYEYYDENEYDYDKKDSDKKYS